MPSNQKNLNPKNLLEQCAAVSSDFGKLCQAVFDFAAEVKKAGGQAFFVGGAVRDQLLGLTPKDFDIEVHGLDSAHVETLAKKLGPAQSIGLSFGILKISNAGHDIDISLPRRETKTGAGHRDFSVGIDPQMGLTEAARRREYTISAIYLNIVTGQLEDPYHGAADLRKKLLRMVDKKTFVEDPLRLLRGMQLVARFGLTVDPDTLTAMQEIVPNMGHLSAERVRTEWQKLVLAERPSLGLQLGRTSGYIEQWLPELSALWTTPQDPRHHPEGNVWDHTLLVIDRICGLAAVAKATPDVQLILALSALAHDLGKPDTTRNVEGRFVSLSHESVGLTATESLLVRLGFEEKLRRRVGALVRNHLRPDQIFQAARAGIEPKLSVFRRLIHDLRPATLPEAIFLATADQLGRGPWPRPDGLMAMPEHYDGLEWWTATIAKNKLDQPLEPILWGHDLVARGWPAGPMIGEAVRLADQLAMIGFSRRDVLQVLATVTKPEETITALRSLVQSESS